MAAKISKEVTDLRVSCRFLLMALVRQGTKVAETLTELVSPHRQEGDAEPGFLASIVALGRRLKASMDQLVEADKRMYDVNAKWTMLREKRDKQTSALAIAIVRLRRLILGHYLDPSLEGLSLQSPRLRVADVLLRQIEMIGTRFGSFDLATMLGLKADEDDPFDPQEAAAPAIAAGEELKATLDEIDATQRDFDVTRIEKDRIKDEHGQLFIHTARSFESYCRLAGNPELAAKVRPSERQPGRREQEEEPLPSPLPEPLPEAESVEAVSEEDATA